MRGILRVAGGRNRMTSLARAVNAAVEDLARLASRQRVAPVETEQIDTQLEEGTMWWRFKAGAPPPPPRYYDALGTFARLHDAAAVALRSGEAATVDEAIAGDAKPEPNPPLIEIEDDLSAVLSPRKAAMHRQVGADAHEGDGWPASHHAQRRQTVCNWPWTCQPRGAIDSRRRGAPAVGQARRRRITKPESCPASDTPRPVSSGFLLQARRQRPDPTRDPSSDATATSSTSLATHRRSSPPRTARLPRTPAQARRPGAPVGVEKRWSSAQSSLRPSGLASRR